jgi:hypothetical protein
MMERNFNINPPRNLAETRERWRKHALHVVTNAGAYKKSLVELAWRFLKGQNNAQI